MNKEHQLTWMRAGGARQLQELQPTEAKQRGGRTSGELAAASGRLREASRKGVERIREIMDSVAHRDADG